MCVACCEGRVGALMTCKAQASSRECIYRPTEAPVKSLEAVMGIPAFSKCSHFSGGRLRIFCGHGFVTLPNL